ncbi:sorting nexin 21 [Leptinotarsa decemlineata]|uniref:sorting nexin 21 n=1 Tax=Leptinotarsa decemlineata TaxID=7539 RepID=UPI003D30AE4F
MTQIMGNERQGLTFEIISTRIIDEIEEKRYVLYTLQARFISGNDDPSPSILERRYTHFFDLYMALKKEQPQLMIDIPFPKKVLLGNFDNELISSRSTEFQSFMNYVADASQLRNSNALLHFLQDIELKQVKELLDKKDHELAYPILENNLRLLNKVYMDRSPAVLLALVRLLACSVLIPTMPNSLKWADLAFHRFEGVSDSDLLELYVPLLQTCVIVWTQNDKTTEEVERRLSQLHKQGVKSTENTSLLAVVNKVAQKIFG